MVGGVHPTSARNLGSSSCHLHTRVAVEGGSGGMSGGASVTAWQTDSGQTPDGVLRPASCVLRPASHHKWSQLEEVSGPDS